MQTLNDSVSIDKFLLSLGADSDGGNFALVGGRKAVCIDHAYVDPDGKEVWYISLYESFDWVHAWADMVGEMGNPVEITIYETQEQAMKDYITTITSGTDKYLHTCP